MSSPGSASRRPGPTWLLAARLIPTLLAIAVFTALGPAEKSLGDHVRVVYLHGAWVWTSLFAILAAAIAGFAGLIAGRKRLQSWSRALGRTGLLFWFAYLPLSLWAMQSNWDGLFLAEPRWRMALAFAVAGLLLQAGVTLLEAPAWASAGNILYAAALLAALQNTERVMHPSSPILTSDSIQIKIFFAGLVLLCLLAALLIARWQFQLERARA